MMKHWIAKLPRECREKIAYATEREAWSVACWLQERYVYVPGQARPEAYMCRHGAHWHVGHRRRQAPARRREPEIPEKGAS